MSDVFKSKFRKVTNGLFEYINWSNMVVAGEFVFALMNNNPSMVEGMSVDIYIYGDIQVRKAKIGYLLHYFSNHEEYFIVNDVLTIVMKRFNHDIRIISSKVDVAKLLNQFSANYERLCYNGENVVGHISSILALKYKLAVFDGDRIIDSVKKGLYVGVSKLHDGSRIIKDNRIEVPVNSFFGSNKGEIIRSLWFDGKQGMDEIMKYSYCGDIYRDYMAMESSVVLCKMGQLYCWRGKEYVVIESISDMQNVIVNQVMIDNRRCYVPQYVMHVPLSSLVFIANGMKLVGNCEWNIVKHFCHKLKQNGVHVTGVARRVSDTLLLHSVVVKLNLKHVGSKDVLTLKALY